MKVAAHQAAKILQDSAAFAGILLYGEDVGRVRAHATAATRAVLGAAADPFRYSALTREEHGRLREEVTSLSLGGGRRVIRVQEATDALAAVLDSLAKHRADALVICEAATLTPRSKLRMMAEKHPHWAAIACYAESGTAVSGDITRVVSEAGLSIEPNALTALTHELAGDSGRRRSELEKLCLYAAGAGVVTLDMALACCSASLDATIGAAVSAALSGQAGQCDALMEELRQEGASGPGLLAVLASQVHRVLKVRLLMESGQGLDEACRALQPPVFPRQMPGFQQEVQRWTVSRLESLGRAIHDADLACKRGGSPDFAIAGRLLGAVAGRAVRT